MPRFELPPQAEAQATVQHHRRPTWPPESDGSMKGLLYNLLQELALESDCGEEAWELVAEFAAAETLLRNASAQTVHYRGKREDSTCASYEAPTAAMLTCLIMSGGDGETHLPLIDMEVDGWFSDGEASEREEQDDEAVELDDHLLLDEYTEQKH